MIKRALPHLYIIFGIILCLILSCSSTAPISGKGGKGASSFRMNPHFRIFQHHPDSLQLFFEVSTDELLYSREKEGGLFKAKLELMLDFDIQSKGEFDHRILFTDLGPRGSQERLIGSTTIAAPGDISGLRVGLSDLNRGVEIRRTIVFNPKNFSAVLFRDTTTLKPIVSPEYLGQAPLYLENPLQRNLRIEEIRFNQLHPLPPFAKKSDLDGQFEITSWGQPITDQVVQFSDSSHLVLLLDEENQANYIISRVPYTTSSEGTSDAFILPMRYISNREEYAVLTHSKDPKKGIEDFWIKLASNKDKAKRLASIYFERVEFANVEFANFRPGCLTDRGMIYIVFGKPTNIYRRNTYETWIYGDENSMMSLSFTFYLDNIPPFGKDFILSRSISYKNTWFRAVETWRNGRHTNY